MNLEIIIDGVHHKLVRDEYECCSKCSLQNICVESDICIAFDVGDYEYFQIVEE